MNNKFFKELDDLISLAANSKSLLSVVNEAANILADAVAYGGTIYIAGNGGSAAEATHFSGEILGRYKKVRKGLAAVSLSADLASITAIGNDFGFDYIYERQLEGLFDPLKDVFIGLSTSGNSQNILAAIQYVDSVGGRSVNLLGEAGGLINEFYFNRKEHINIMIPTKDTPRIQEMHLLILHYFAGKIEDKWVELNYGK